MGPPERRRAASSKCEVCTLRLSPAPRTWRISPDRLICSSYMGDRSFWVPQGLRWRYYTIFRVGAVRLGQSRVKQRSPAAAFILTSTVRSVFIKGVPFLCSVSIGTVMREVCRDACLKVFMLYAHPAPSSSYDMCRCCCCSLEHDRSLQQAMRARRLCWGRANAPHLIQAVVILRVAIRCRQGLVHLNGQASPFSRTLLSSCESSGIWCHKSCCCCKITMSRNYTTLVGATMF